MYIDGYKNLNERIKSRNLNICIPMFIAAWITTGKKQVETAQVPTDGRMNKQSGLRTSLMVAGRKAPASAGTQARSRRRPHAISN